MSILKQYIEEGKVVTKDLEEATTDDLLELKQRVDSEIAVISGQLTAAKSKFAKHGERSNSDWFSRATMAKRLKGQLSQHIQILLRKKKTEQKNNNRQINDRSFEKRLLEAMDIILEPEIKEQVLKKARELLE